VLPKLPSDQEGSSETPPRCCRQFPCQFAEGISRSSALIVLIPRHRRHRHSWWRGGTSHRWWISHTMWPFGLRGTSLQPWSIPWTTSTAYGRPASSCHVCSDMARNNYNGYVTLLACLTQVDNPEACFLTRMGVIFTRGTPAARRPCTVELKRAAANGHNVVWPMWPLSSSTGPMPMLPLPMLRGGA
jgi:hypothetical protein